MPNHSIHDSKHHSLQEIQDFLVVNFILIHLLINLCQLTECICCGDMYKGLRDRKSKEERKGEIEHYYYANSKIKRNLQ